MQLSLRSISIAFAISIGVGFMPLAHSDMTILRPLSALMPLGLTDGQAEQVAALAALDSSWLVVSQEANGFVARLKVRGHIVTTKALVTAGAITVIYVSSENLATSADCHYIDAARNNEMRQGKNCIHSNYIAWVQQWLDGLPHAHQKLALFGALLKP